jgi:hypothetical protein
MTIPPSSQVDLAGASGPDRPNSAGREVGHRVDSSAVRIPARLESKSAAMAARARRIQR